MMFKSLPSHPELDKLIKQSIAAFNAMSPEEQKAHRRAQAISWVYGNLALDGVKVTKEEVAKRFDEMGLY